MRVYFLHSVLLMILLAILPIQAQALGVGPSLTEVEAKLNSQDVVREIQVSRKNPAQGQYVEVKFGGELAPYLGLFQNSRVILAQGEYITKVPFKILISKLSEGEHIGTITVTQIAHAEQGEGAVTILSGAQVRVKVVVQGETQTKSVEQTPVIEISPIQSPQVQAPSGATLPSPTVVDEWRIITVLFGVVVLAIIFLFWMLRRS